MAFIPFDAQDFAMMASTGFLREEDRSAPEHAGT